MEIKINKIEQWTGKDSGTPYWVLETDKGRMSCFDKPIADKLQEAWQKQIIMYVDAIPSKDGKYVNIRKLMTPEENADYEEANKNYEATRPKGTPIDIDDGSREMKGATAYVKPQDFGKPQNITNITNNGYNPTSMYVSYAKDIFIALTGHYISAGKDAKVYAQFANETMDAAINLVKQAHKEFS